MAEETKKPETEVTETEEQEHEENSPTVEELLAQIAQKDAAYERLKVASDKSSKEASELKKQLRSKQTAEEQADEARKEQEASYKEYVKELEDFKNKSMAKDRYLMQGMSAEMAAKAAEAEVSGDMDSLAKIQKQHTESALKAAKSEWQKSRPPINAGTEADGKLTKEQFDTMSLSDKSKLYKENKAEYDRLNG